MITLFGNVESGNDYKVRLLLAHLGIGYRRVEVWQLGGEPRSEAFLALNPIGKIPAVQLDDGSVLSESGALLHHFADGTPYWPAPRSEQTECLRWMFFEQYSHEPHIAVNRYWLNFLDDTSGLEDRIAENHERGHRALRAMASRLDGARWFSGGAYGIADIALYAYMCLAHEGGFDLSVYPSIEAWLGRVAAQPGHIEFHDERGAATSLTFAQYLASVPS